MKTFNYVNSSLSLSFISLVLLLAEIEKHNSLLLKEIDLKHYVQFLETQRLEPFLL